jgi:ribosomal protein S27AE
MGGPLMKVYCPNCIVQEPYKVECRRCKATGFLKRQYKVEEKILEMKDRCGRCRGTGMVTKVRDIRTELIFMHPQENDPKRWVCTKCHYQKYLPDKTGMFPKPEAILPPVEIDSEGTKNSKDILQDYIKKRFKT